MADRLTRHQESLKRRKFSSLLRTRDSQRTTFEIRRLVSRSLETDELWPTHKRKAKRHKRATHANATGAEDSLGPTLWHAVKPDCSPPTASFGLFEYFEQSAQESDATPVHIMETRERCKFQ